MQLAAVVVQISRHAYLAFIVVMDRCFKNESQSIQVALL